MIDKHELTTGAAYRSFEAASINMERWVNALPLSIDLCVDAQVKKRVVQRLVEEISSPYIDALKRSEARHDESEIVSGNLLHRNFSFSPRSGRVALSPRFFAYQIGVFFYCWSRLLTKCALKFCTSKPRETVSGTFLFEAGGGYEADDTKFRDFCANGPVRPLREAKYLVVFSLAQPAKQTSPERVVYCREPLLGYFCTFMSKRDQLRFLVNHLRAPLILLRALLRNPILVVVARDCAYLPAYAFLNNTQLLRDIVITNSRFPAQFLWMKGLESQCYRLHMLWYSQNFIPKQYIGEDLGSNLPSARHIRVDAHWVWTPGFKKYLHELGQVNEIHVVGPLLWYLRSVVQPSPLAGDYSIVLFDVTPIIEDGKTFGAVRNYYSLQTISKFVHECLLACKELSAKHGIDVQVYLKHKRAPEPSHDTRYLAYLQQLVAENSSFHLLETNSDLFQLIGAADLSIAVPYTSTVSVSAAINKKAIYYDASEDLVPDYEATEHLMFANNYTALVRSIETCLLEK